ANVDQRIDLPSATEQTVSEWQFPQNLVLELMSRDGIDICPVTAAIVRIFDGGVQFEITGIVNLAQLLGPRPRRAEQETVAHAFLNLRLQTVIGAVRAIIAVENVVEQRIWTTRLSEQRCRWKWLIDVAHVDQLRSVRANI